MAVWNWYPVSERRQSTCGSDERSTSVPISLILYGALEDRTDPIYELIEKHCGVIVTRVQQRILSVSLSRDDALHLKVKTRAAQHCACFDSISTRITDSLRLQTAFLGRSFQLRDEDRK